LNLSELGRNHLILGELGPKIKEENSSESSGRGWGSGPQMHQVGDGEAPQ